MNRASVISAEGAKNATALAERQFKIYRGAAGLAAIREDWMRVTRALDKPRFFHLYEWYESYLNTLSDSSAYFVLARRKGAPVGVIPLVISPQRLAGTKLRGLSLPHHPHMLLCDAPLTNEGSDNITMSELIAYLRRQQSIQWDVLFFPNLLEDSGLLSALNAGAPALRISEPQTRCNYLPCLPPDELATRLSRNFSGNLRKARNKLAKLNRVEFITARSRSEVDRALDEFLAIEASGWKGEAGERSAINFDDRILSFYQSLSRNFSRIGACEINLLRAEGRCIAGQFCLLTGDTSYILKIGYDEAYAQAAPGNMLLEHTIQRYLQEGEIKYVNLVTDTPWHSCWRPLSYVVSRAWVFNITAAGLTAYSLLRARGPVSRSYRHWLKPLMIAAGWLEPASTLQRISYE
jgi:CelD/BcsL family acetyltransferase involved in cellulose biosynthesis